MLEALGFLSLFGSLTAAIVVIAVYLAITVGAEVENAPYVSIIPTIVFAALIYFGATDKVLSVFTLNNLFMYLGAGLVYSMIRTYFKGVEMANAEAYAKGNYDLKGAVCMWWLLFPISLITWLFGNILVKVVGYLYDCVEWWFQKLFHLHDKKDDKQPL